MATLDDADPRRGRVALAARREGGDRRATAARSTSRAARCRTIATARARRTRRSAGGTSGCTRYRRDVLLRLAALPPTPLEARERLEQLRALEHGIAIGVVEWTAREPVIEVDTPEDLERARGGAGRAGASERDDGMTKQREDQVHLRDRRRGVVARQGPRVGVDRRAARERAASRSRCVKMDPYINVDPGHDEPVPARRGVRHRRRRRDRPRSRPLRALRLDAA